MWDSFSLSSFSRKTEVSNQLITFAHLVPSSYFRYLDANLSSYFR
jgi:hypothetical protein